MHSSNVQKLKWREGLLSFDLFRILLIDRIEKGICRDHKQLEAMSDSNMKKVSTFLLRAILI